MGFPVLLRELPIALAFLQRTGYFWDKIDGRFPGDRFSDPACYTDLTTREEQLHAAVESEVSYEERFNGTGIYH